MKGEMLGDESEIVYVFKKDVKFTKDNLNDLQTKYDALTATEESNESPLAGSSVKVLANAEKSLDRLPEIGLLRTVISAAAFAVLACLYLAIRHHYASGATLFVALGVGAALTSALVLITRMPITGNLLYVLFFNLLFTAICTMFTLNNVRKAQKEDKKIDAETLVKSSVAVWQVLTFAAATTVALVLLGAIATSAVRWFAAIALLSVVAGVFASLLVAPACYLVVKKFADAKDAQRARYDYKKS
jgi:preprotein translocase subunit SecF